MAALAYFLVFCLYLHACTARLLMVADKKSVAQLQFTSKDVETSDHKASSIVQLDNHKLFSVGEGENNEGKTTKSSHSWKTLHQANGTEISKRAEGSTVEESSTTNAEENVSSKDSGTAEDIVVMDYAQPHRKPPIHNKGT